MTIEQFNNLKHYDNFIFSGLTYTVIHIEKRTETHLIHAATTPIGLCIFTQDLIEHMALVGPDAKLPMIPAEFIVDSIQCLSSEGNGKLVIIASEDANNAKFPDWMLPEGYGKFKISIERIAD